MARYFLDSSALVKWYHVESGSPKVAALFDDSSSRLFVSRLALVEVTSAFARLVREGVLSHSAFEKLIDRLNADVAAGTIAVAAVSGPRLASASEVLRSHGLTDSVRTLDAIHLATAQALDARTRLTAFVAADKNLLNSAVNACGLAVYDVA